MNSRKIVGVPKTLLLSIGLFAMTLCMSSVADTLTNMPDNTWVKIDPQPEMDIGILAFSGMALDSKHQKLLVFGGGHNDYWGNEIWAFDIQALQWTRMYEPDPRPDTLSSKSFKAEYPGAVFYPDTNEPLADARPLSRHTYDTVEFISAHGVMFSSGQYTWGDGQYDYCWACRDTWTYDLQANKWTYRTNENVPKSEGVSAAYDPVSDTVYLISQGSTWGWSFSADAWTKIQTNGSPTTAIETIAEFDSKRGYIYLFGGEYPTNNELWKYDINKNSWTRLSPSGTSPNPGGGYGMTYDSVNDVLLVFKNQIWAYDPQLNEWMEMKTAVSPPQVGRVHGNFKYDPVSNVSFLVMKNSSFSVETWAYRFKGDGIVQVVPNNPTDFKAN